MADRYESSRAAWLLEHEASWHMSDRRMADGLRRRAARKARGAAGSTETLHHQARIKPIISRFLSRSDEGGEAIWRMLAVLVMVPALALAIGPAVALSLAAYAGYSTAMLAAGRRPLGWPWLILAVVLAAISALLVPYGSLLRVEVIPYFNVHVATEQIGTAYLWVQGVLACVLTAWNVRRHGWPGATVGGTASRLPAEATTMSATAGDYLPEPPEDVALPVPPEVEEMSEEEIEALAGLLDDEDDSAQVEEVEPVLVEPDSPEKALLIEQGINEKNWKLGEAMAYVDEREEQSNV